MSSDLKQQTRYMHWLSALIIIGLLSTGLYMSDGNHYGLYDWHKAIGFIALAIIIIRLLIRYRHPWPSAALGTPHQKLVHYTHQFLLLASLLMPISGLLYSGFGGYGVSIGSVELIPSYYNEKGQVIAPNLMLSNLGDFIHQYLGYLFTLIVIMHLLAALKHHFIDRDDTLSRMLTGKAQSSHTR
ncbi:cytochrome b [Thalassotalea ganghwensis]